MDIPSIVEWLALFAVAAILGYQTWSLGRRILSALRTGEYEGVSTHYRVSKAEASASFWVTIAIHVTGWAFLVWILAFIAALALRALGDVCGWLNSPPFIP